MTSHDTASLQRLADTVWAERRLIELLLYRLVAAKLLLASDERRFISAALSEVDNAVELLRGAESDREAVVVEVARHLGVDVSEVSLQWLAESAPEPFGTVFSDHRHACLDLVDEIETCARANRRLASTGLHEVNATLAAFNGSPPDRVTYDASGHQHLAPSRPGSLDEVL